MARQPSNQLPASKKKRHGWPVWGALAGMLVCGAVAVPWLLPDRSVPWNVILVSIDTLRADRLGCYGKSPVATPHIDRLASEGVLFENAATATPLTLPSHTSIFTGRSPLRHGVIDNYGLQVDAAEETLAEVLRVRGYATGGFVGSFVLDSQWGIAQGFDTYFDDFDTVGYSAADLEANERAGDEVLSHALDWIGERQDAPFFAFIHFFDPHAPYAPPAGFRMAGKQDDASLYDGEVAFVDSLIGNLISRLRELDLYDNTLVVLLSDHGESLGDHGEKAHGFFIYDSTVHVPLVIRVPGSPGGGRVHGQVRTIDVMPTVLDVLGIETPTAVEGVSLATQLRSPDRETDLLAYVESHYARLHFGWAPLRGLRTDRHKFIDAPRDELYDLSVDPGELHDLSTERVELAQQSSKLLDDLLRHAEPRTAHRSTPDRESVARLQSLGYLAGATVVDSETEGLPDPKDKLPVFNRVEKGMMAHLAGDDDQAVAILSRVLAGDPKIVTAATVLGTIYLDQKQLEKAANVFQTALQWNSDCATAIYGLALSHEAMGDREEAVREFRRLLEIQPHYPGAIDRLAKLHLKAGDAAEAERLLSRYASGKANVSLQLPLIEAIHAQGRRAEAIEKLRVLARENPTNVEVRLALANFLLQGGDLQGALETARQTERLGPQDTRVWNLLGTILARRGDREGAFMALQKAVELDPTSSIAQRNLGVGLALRGDFQGAEAALKAAVKLDLHSAPARTDLGKLFARLGRITDAEKAFEKATQLDPDFVPAHNYLGRIYLQTGRLEQAIVQFRRALQIDPSHAEAQASLQRAIRAQTASPASP